MEHTKTEIATKQDIVRFVVLGLIGVFLYFIPLGGTSVPVVMLVNAVKGLLGQNLNYLVLASLAILTAVIIGARVFKNTWCDAFLGKVSTYKQIHYLVAFLIVLAVWFQLPPSIVFANPDIGGQILSLAGTVTLTVSICGWFIVFILRSGIVDFVGILLEPLMRPLFKMPGAAAVNCISSFVVSASVGVYMSDQYYTDGVYSRREAISAAICFSTVSVGYVGVLCSLAGIETMYGPVLLLAFAMVFLLTVITVRIPPLRGLPDTYFEQSEAVQTSPDDSQTSRFRRAVNAAALRSRQFTLKEFINSLVSALKFSQTIIAYMIPIVIVTLSLVHLTPLFTWLGKPIAPILALLGLPDAQTIAPAVLLGFIEVSLPAITVSNGVAAQSAFFVVLLSICQVVFLTEAGNAMLSSKMKISFVDLLANFLVRTVISIPIIALLSHLLF